MGADRARAYAAWARSGRDVSFEPTLAVVCELLPSPPLRVLDVGCGEGRVGADLRARGYEVVGVDAEAAMVELAAAHHEAVVADATALPFGEASFDAPPAMHSFTYARRRCLAPERCQAPDVRRAASRRRQLPARSAGARPVSDLIPG